MHRNDLRLELHLPLGVPWVVKLHRASLQNEVVDILKERPITCGVPRESDFGPPGKHLYLSLQNQLRPTCSMYS